MPRNPDLIYMQFGFTPAQFEYVTRHADAYKVSMQGFFRMMITALMVDDVIDGIPLEREYAEYGKRQ